MWKLKSVPLMSRHPGGRWVRGEEALIVFSYATPGTGRKQGGRRVGSGSAGIRTHYRRVGSAWICPMSATTDGWAHWPACTRDPSLRLKDGSGRDDSRSRQAVAGREPVRVDSAHIIVAWISTRR